ncbi:MAG: redox-regulated ATPase YchF [Candidatus Portnoybacteria bacterium CG10_big_fil_rev_8_21_14_0_10_44_7]|uniref:Ribosome-binding ATPase YchF n=1 Tax=Candidatus Portnoybacteria bacterium CG10_big_fil_rev_8_21_14_0_10_44_7 TaxID=1974816 RepID=A0A2M8KIG6_9BACT|nr:MAG: redox-regulated ATPase YchF [Candidatus Portnoybacteria bacterium CG10_big_fil_rev_8_21_14_0_10_44_7]
MLSVGIVGLPNVGKSTLFQALTKKQVNIANFPFCTIDPNVGVVEVPDQRLEQLAAVSRSAQIIPTAIEFYDIAGLVAGASQGEGLGNQFLASIREVDAILQVVRAFTDQKITHVSGQPDPAKDTEIINLELVLKDLETVLQHLPKIQKNAQRGDRDAQAQLPLLEKLNRHLQQGQPARTLMFADKEKQYLKTLNLLSAKPVIYLVNRAANKPALNYPQNLTPVLEIDIGLENELGELPPAEAQTMRQALPCAKNGLDEVISLCYIILELETFFTTGEKETRAWTVKKGARAPQAAGKIHTDFERGFIRAEVVAWDQLVKAQGWNGTREKGLVRTEGKEYVVRDGDVIIFKTAT